MDEKKKKVLTIITELRTSETDDLDYVRITISDTGDGINESDMHKIFEPFFTTKESGKGTGLGLSISYGIIQDHGGGIRAINNKTGGASFFIELPISKGG